jgi:predicted SAM-dependent methyltransferase
MPDNRKNILNLGCGADIREDAVNLDIIKRKGVNVVYDFKKRIPFVEGRFERVIANYVLCQICLPEDFMCVMNEIWRVLKKEGILEIRVPDARFACAFQDPMDCRRFVKETFDYFDKDHYRYKVFNYGFKPWKIITIKKEREDRLYAELQKE